MTAFARFARRIGSGAWPRLLGLGGLMYVAAWPAAAQTPDQMPVQVPAANPVSVTPQQDPLAGLDGHQCGSREPGDTRPRIGLALGGGGARGIAHIRVLRKLEELHIPVDCIAGTSAGALVGALYAAGRSPQDIEDIVLENDWRAMFSDTLPRQDRSLRRKSDDYTRLSPIGVGVGGDRAPVQLAGGMSQGQRMIEMFEEATGAGRVVGDFDDLPIPFRAVATDLNTGNAVALDHGSLAMAMRASMSLPGILRPVEIDGRVLLDGGVANQIPIDVVRAMGADRIIAVDVGTPLRQLGADASVLDVVDQMSGFLTVGSAARQLATLGPQDLVIRPDLAGRVTTGGFDKAPLALEIGQQAADAAAAQLSRYSVDAATYAQFQRRQRHVGDTHVALDRAVVQVEHADRPAGELGGIALFQEDHPARGRNDGRHVRGDEVLALAQPHQQRAAHARADQAPGLGAAEHGQRIGAGQFLHRGLQRGEQVLAAGHVVVDQVGDHLGVGLRLEHVAQRGQALALGLVVLDDAVVDQGQVAVADVRMGIGLGHPAMGGPAGMADAEHAAEAFRHRRLLHLGHPAGAPHPAHAGRVRHGDSGRVIAAVLQALEAFDQDRNHIAICDRTDNAAHAVFQKRIRARF